MIYYMQDYFKQDHTLTIKLRECVLNYLNDFKNINGDVYLTNLRDFQ